MFIHKIVNSYFNSNTYILYTDSSSNVWIVDPGDSVQVLQWIYQHGKDQVAGMLITHAHFDHIYGINELLEHYPETPIYTSIHGGVENMKDKRKNGSKYSEWPFEIFSDYFIETEEHTQVQLWDDVLLTVYETPGHSKDSISFSVNNNLFTGDALIPKIRVVTKLKEGNKAVARKTLNRIFEEFGDDVIINPGHELSCKLGVLKNDNFEYI